MKECMKKYLKLVLVLSTFVPALGCLNQDAPDCMIQQLYSDISYHAHESSCSLFYKCISGIRYELKCKTGFRFNLQLGTCDFSENVPCVLCNMEDTGGGDRGCPPTPTCTIPEAGQTKPYPEDCNYYIYCDITGAAIKRRCPIGQEFSPSSKRCTTPETAGCPKCYITTPLPSTTTTSMPICPETGSCEGLTEGTLLPYPSDCSKYLYCKADGTSIIRTCFSNLHFSVTLNRCVDQQMANCPFCIVPTSTSTTFEVYTTTQSTTLGVCPITPTCSIDDIGLTKSYPPDCYKYIYCDVTGAVVRNCQPTYQFNTNVGFCTSPETAQCPLCEVITTTTEMDISSTDYSSQEPCPTVHKCSVTESGMLFPYPEDCTKYIYCTEAGTNQIRYCYKGLEYSDELLRCVDPNLSNCRSCLQTSSTDISTLTTESKTTTESTTVSTTELATIDPCPNAHICSLSDAGRTYPYPQDCSKYIYCSEAGSTVIRSCYTNLEYSINLGRCVDPLMADCRSCLETSTITTTESTTEMLTEDPCPLPECTAILEWGVTKPHPTNCSLYIYCEANGNNKIRNCPPGREFSPTLKRCVESSTSGCILCSVTTTTLLISTTTDITESTTEITTDDVTESTTETTTLDPCPLPSCQPILEWGATKPHPKNCSLYIYCEMTGTVKVRTCPIGRQFSPTKSRCEDPATAGCVLCSVTTTTSEMTTTEEITGTPSESTSQSTTDIPTENPCPLPECIAIVETGVTKPHPTNCSLYIYCEPNGNQNIRKCPLGKEFSPVLSRCVDRANSGCVLCDLSTTTEEATSTTEIETSLSSESSTITETSTESTTDLDSTTESTTNTDTSTDSTTETQSTTVTDSTTEADSTTITDSTTESDSTTVTDSTTESDSTTITDSTTELDSTTVTDSTTEADSTTITDSTTEADSTTVTDSTTEADSTTITDSTTQTDTTSEVPTDTDTTTEEITTSTEPAECPIPTCEFFDLHDLKPYPANCSMYIYCSEEGLELRYCPSGHTFSATLMKCTRPEISQCVPCELLTTTEEISSETTEIVTETTTVSTTTEESSCDIPTCQPYELHNLKPYPPDCNRYIYCSATGPELRKCPIGMNFSPTLMKCVTPELANCIPCGPIITPPPPPTTPSSCDIPKCYSYDVNHLKPYPPDCNKYIYCTASLLAEIRSCPLGKHFSSTLSQCTSPLEARCTPCEVVTYPADPDPF